MKLMNDPVLRECQRVLDRAPNLTAEYAARLMGQLAKLDDELADLRLDAETKPLNAKAAKR